MTAILMATPLPMSRVTYLTCPGVCFSFKELFSWVMVIILISEVFKWLTAIAPKVQRRYWKSEVGG
jgi:hypothetical protein